MKLLFAGNVANNGYNETKLMRRYGVEAFLLMEKNPPKFQDPLYLNPELKGKYPEWIIFFDKQKPLWYLDIIKQMRKFDIIQAHYDLSIFAYLSRKPFISQEVGSDLREIAFQNTLRGRLLRRSYRKAKIFLFAGATAISLLSKLKIKNSLFFPMLITYTLPFREDQVKNTPKNKFTIFHPTSLWWRSGSEKIKKGNDRLILAYEKFVKKHPNSILLIVKWGPDAKETQELVNSLRLNEYVKFLDGPLDSIEMKKYYLLCDVVADQFMLGDLGGVAREALLFSKPLITFCYMDEFKELYGKPPPILNAQTIEEIESKLEVCLQKETRDLLGKQGEEWIKKYHSPDIIAKKMIRMYQAILEGDSISTIKQKIKKID